MPKETIPMPSGWSSLARCVQLATRLPATLRVKMYADPLSSPKSSLLLAPTTTVSSLIATATPNSSPFALSEASSSARCVQPAVRLPAISRVKMYADPGPPYRAPTTTVSPLIAALIPNCALVAPSGGSSLARRVQLAARSPATLRVKMCTDPLFLPASSSLRTPTVTVSPLIATLIPNWSPTTPSEPSSLARCVQLAVRLPGTSRVKI
mmetsp:Transcript_12526/g.30384  ORF Transcript_12526/g.30384 Transcript_12526/m.30384 type:complete len:209 (+) Transcript_12526:297-923(+)